MKEFDNIVPVFQPDERGNSFGEIFQLSKFKKSSNCNKLFTVSEMLTWLNIFGESN